MKKFILLIVFLFAPFSLAQTIGHLNVSIGGPDLRASLSRSPPPVDGVKLDLLVHSGPSRVIPVVGVWRIKEGFRNTPLTGACNHQTKGSIRNNPRVSMSLGEVTVTSGYLHCVITSPVGYFSTLTIRSDTVTLLIFYDTGTGYLYWDRGSIVDEDRLQYIAPLQRSIFRSNHKVRTTTDSLGIITDCTYCK